ncbi:unnamed protein product [Xylocopa violacea]|uniref:Exonuclease domain-containing protein n=1 Tax=Xylocopa violacea TaxID=135666 RepID=A0ABP1P1W8_XYLVO
MDKKLPLINSFTLLSKTASATLCTDTNTEKNNLNDHIVWVDMEMSELDVNTSQILEIACLISDRNLKILCEELNIVVHQPDEILNNMNDWCSVTHQNVELQDAEQTIIKYLKTHVKEGTCPLAGSSVYMDRMFLYKYMPSVNNYLHYRIIDTSTIKELIKRWNINVPTLKKVHKHRALSDIRESIKELELYKKYIFGPRIKN